jgi:hypothetical protein
MTQEHKASRTIVKSPPELWAECSVAQSLARHLGEFGEIKITRLEPETTVAWEGEHASGTVRLEPSGWGTQVTLTATPIVVAVVPEPVVEPELEPVAVEPEPEPVAVEPVAVEPEPEAMEEIVHEVEEPHDADESGDDEEEDASDHLPRWQVFSRLWSRLGRKTHQAEDEPGEDEAETPEAVGEAPEPVVEMAEPELVSETEEAEPDAVDDSPMSVPGLDHQALLVGALDSLGQAHHRPFSRA